MLSRPLYGTYLGNAPATLDKVKIRGQIIFWQGADRLPIGTGRRRFHRDRCRLSHGLGRRLGCFGSCRDGWIRVNSRRQGYNIISCINIMLYCWSNNIIEVKVWSIFSQRKMNQIFIRQLFSTNAQAHSNVRRLSGQFPCVRSLFIIWREMPANMSLHRGILAKRRKPFHVSLFD